MANIPNINHWHSLGGLPGLWDSASHSAIAHDSQGNVYVAGCAVRRMEDTTMRFLQRFSSNGTLVPAADGTLPWYSGISPHTQWAELAAERMVVDETNHKLYVLVRGWTYWAPDHWYYYLYSHDLTTGDMIWFQYVGPSNEANGHLDVDGDGNIWVAIAESFAVAGSPPNDVIKLAKFSHDGTGTALRDGGRLHTTKQRDLFAFGGRKEDSSLYLAYRESESGQPIHDLVVERYDHDLTFLGRSTCELSFVPSGPNVHEHEFHDGIVDVHDRFVIGGYYAVDRSEDSGTFRSRHPLVFGFDTNGTEFFRYVDDTFADAFFGTVLADSREDPDLLRAIVRPGEGAEVLYTISTFYNAELCILCIRDDGTLADSRVLTLGSGESETTIASCDYRALPLAFDFTYLPGTDRGWGSRVVRAGMGLLINPVCDPMVIQQPSVLSFHMLTGLSLRDFVPLRMAAERIPLGPMPISFPPDPRISPPIPVPSGPEPPERPFPAAPAWRTEKPMSFSQFAMRHAWNDVRALERMVLARISSSDVPTGPDTRDSLAETLKRIPVTANFTEELREQVCGLPLEGKGNTELQEVLLQALNAIVADRVLAAQPVPVQVRRVGSGEVHRYGELAWLEVDGSVEAGPSTLQVVSGAEKIPEGTDTLWPVVTFRFTNRHHISGRLHLAFRSFRFKGYSSRLRMLAVDDKRMVDITESVDTLGRAISGRVEGLRDVMLVHISPDLSPSRSS